MHTLMYTGAQTHTHLTAIAFELLTALELFLDNSIHQVEG